MQKNKKCSYKTFALTKVLAAGDTWGKVSLLKFSRMSVARERQRYSNKFCAFTLAEVLITLAIIGVVAVLTIPTVIRNYQKQQTVVKLKKAYSILSRIENEIIMENGGIEPRMDGGIDLTTYYTQYWQPKLKILKSCDNAVDCGYKTDTAFTLLNGDSYWVDEYKIFDLVDGMTLLFRASRINVDLNGAKNGPNILGKDIFAFRISKNETNSYQIVPYCNDFSYGSQKSYCNKKGINCCQGESCTKLIMTDGWKINYDW